MKPPRPHRVAVLGARPAEVQALCGQLANLADLHLVDLPDAQTALLVGLPHRASAQDKLQDAQCRERLMASGLPWQVLQAAGPPALEAALWALGLPQADPSARLHLQSGLAGGRVPWVCGQCSDPDCEHQLFSRLVRPETPGRPPG